MEEALSAEKTRINPPQNRLISGGAGALLFLRVPREQEAKLKVSPAADSRVEGVTAGGRDAGCWHRYRGAHLIRPTQCSQVIHHPLSLY